MYAIRSTVVTLILLGLVYPLVVTLSAQVLFPTKSRGSLVVSEQGQTIGSQLIGQRFTAAYYFQGRPSAAGIAGYDASASGGSNLGPTSLALRARVMRSLTQLAQQNPDQPATVPVELVTASGSGLDPHLSPQAALWQVPRIAKSRGLSQDRVRAVVHELTEPRDLYVFGEPRVNVLLLNLALDRRFGRKVDAGS
jgi:K+-transporting ATPase ATPase C chain